MVGVIAQGPFEQLLRRSLVTVGPFDVGLLHQVLGEHIGVELVGVVRDQAVEQLVGTLRILSASVDPRQTFECFQVIRVEVMGRQQVLQRLILLIQLL